MDDAPLTSTAHVATDRADRYAKQLAAHLSRRLETAWDEATGRGVVHLDGGRCDLTRDPSGLGLHAAVDAALATAQQTSLVARIEDVVGRHLVRFGARDELVVAWQRSDGSAGGVFEHTDGPEAGHER